MIDKTVESRRFFVPGMVAGAFTGATIGVMLTFLMICTFDGHRELQDGNFGHFLCGLPAGNTAQLATISALFGLVIGAPIGAAIGVAVGTVEVAMRHDVQKVS